MATLRQLIREIIEDLPTVVDVESLIRNFIEIAGDVGSRTIAAHQCREHMMQYPEIAKEFWTSKKFKDINDFNDFIEKLQTTARKAALAVRKKTEKEFRDAKREWDMEQIEAEVRRQTAIWDDKIAKMNAK